MPTRCRPFRLPAPARFLRSWVSGACIAGMAAAGSAHAAPRVLLGASLGEAFSAQAVDSHLPQTLSDVTLANEWTAPLAHLGWAVAAQPPRPPIIPPFAHVVPVADSDGSISLLTDAAPVRQASRTRTFMLAGYAGPPNLLASAAEIDHLFVEGALQPIARGAAALSALAQHRSLDGEVRRADMGTQVLAIVGLIGLLAWRKLGSAGVYPR